MCKYQSMRGFTTRINRATITKPVKTRSTVVDPGIHWKMMKSAISPSRKNPIGTNSSFQWGRNLVTTDSSAVSVSSGHAMAPMLHRTLGSSPQTRETPRKR